MSLGGVCPDCGRSLVNGACAVCDGEVGAPFVQRELVGLIVLGVIVVVGFLLTRTAAAANRALRAQDAAAWHALALSGHVRDHVGVIQALRRAASLDRDSVQYRLDLADALAEQGDDDAARQVLLDVRESTPESPDVNTRLARLAVRGGRVDDADRYYQNAIHGVWQDDMEPMRQRLRIELIRYLLAQGRRSRALAELIALSGAPPPNTEAQIEIAELLRDAGDPVRALTLFRRVLDRDAANVTAREGAGIAAFEAGDYVATTRYLRGLAGLSPRGLEVQAVAGFVVDRDPMRRGLAAPERRRRLRSAIETVLDRLRSCVIRSSDPDVRARLERLDGEAHDAEMMLRRPFDVSDVGDLLAQLASIERQTLFCGPSSPADDGVLILAGRYAADQ